MDLGRHFTQTCTYIYIYIYIYIDWHWILMTLDGETSPSIWPVVSSHQIREALTALGADVLAPWFHQFPYDNSQKNRETSTNFSVVTPSDIIWSWWNTSHYNYFVIIFDDFPIHYSIHCESPWSRCQVKHVRFPAPECAPGVSRIHWTPDAINNYHLGEQTSHQNGDSGDGLWH